MGNVPKRPWDVHSARVLDGNGGSDTGTANITINPVNDGPVAQDDAFTGEMGDDITGNVLTNDSDVDGDTLEVEEATLTTTNGGTVVMLANGDFTYTPDPMFEGVDMFEYSILDGNGGTATATVTLTVEMPEDAIMGTNGRDFLKGTSDDDLILGKGGKDWLFGKDGDDILSGGTGRDALFGGRGDDMLEGGEGHDWLFGGKGDDVLEGGSGYDALFGGRGADTFVFKKETAFDGVDKVFGFKTREGDALDISDILEDRDPLGEALSDFVQVQRASFGRTVVKVDADGTENGANFETVAVLYGVRTDLETLVDNGGLIVE